MRHRAVAHTHIPHRSSPKHSSLSILRTLPQPVRICLNLPQEVIVHRTPLYYIILMFITMEFGMADGWTRGMSQGRIIKARAPWNGLVPQMTGVLRGRSGADDHWGTVLPRSACASRLRHQRRSARSSPPWIHSSALPDDTSRSTRAQENCRKVEKTQEDSMNGCRKYKILSHA